MSETKEFEFLGHEAVLICPDTPAQGNPYVWRMEFLYAFNQADMALLDKGFHIAYCSFCDEYGSSEAISLYKKFHDFLSENYSLSSKAALFGFSRGGLYGINYSLAYPEDVSCLYLDAPVIDITSWPGGLGKGVGAPSEWSDLKTRILKTDDDTEAGKAELNPVNRLKELAALNIPVILVAGGSDEHVPYEENGLKLAEEYKKQNREISVTVKPECGHHPHSLEDPAVIVDFVISHFYGDSSL